MKLKCIKDTVSKGFLNKREEKVSGITRGATYNGLLLSQNSGQFATTPYFFIFNDNNEWCRYDVCHFQPNE